MVIPRGAKESQNVLTKSYNAIVTINLSYPKN
jgi:hypothetical protein